MKMYKIREDSLFVLAFSVELSACGGRGSSSDSGSNGDVTLSLNGSNQTFGEAEFTFSETVNAGEKYTVAVTSSPTDQNCTVLNGSGMADQNVNDIVINCAANPPRLETSDR